MTNKGRDHSQEGVKYTVEVEKSEATAILTVEVLEIDGRELSRSTPVKIRLYKNLYGEWNS